MSTSAGSFRNLWVCMPRFRALSGPVFRSAGRLVFGLGILGLVSGCAGGPGSDPLPTSEVLLKEAKAKMEKEKYYQARELLKSVVNNPSTDPPILAEAQLLLADAYFQHKGYLNLTEAQSRYQTFLSFHPRHPSADYAQFQLAMCFFLQVLEPDRDQNQTRKAIEEFRKVENLYPGSPYVEPAREKIQECRDRIAEQSYLVGRFYLRRGTPQAAIQRFLSVLEEYPQYSGREKLYFYLAQAYQRNGEQEKAREYLETLLREFPDGEHAKDAHRALRKLESEIHFAGPVKGAVSLLTFRFRGKGTFPKRSVPPRQPPRSHPVIAGGEATEGIFDVFEKSILFARG